MKSRFLPFLTILVITLGCTSNTSEQDCASDECLRKQAYDKVIAVHDSVMAKMSYISELKGQIEQRMNSEEDSLMIAGWQSLMINLDSTDDAMWVWMRQFNSDLEEVAIDEALLYLKSEQDNINEVARKINEAIAIAEQKLTK